MITVKYETIIQEVFGLVELELFFKGHQCMLKVPSTTPKFMVDRLRKSANQILTRVFSDLFEETK